MWSAKSHTQWQTKIFFTQPYQDGACRKTQLEKYNA